MNVVKSIILEQRIKTADKPMRWYYALVKYLIPISLVFGFLQLIVNTYEQLALYNNSLIEYIIAQDIGVLNFLTLTTAIISLIMLVLIRESLAIFSSKSITYMLVYFWINISSHIIVVVVMSYLIGMYDTLINLAPELLPQEIMLVLNYIYFYKRRHLFDDEWALNRNVNEGSHIL